MYISRAVLASTLSVTMVLSSSSSSSVLLQYATTSALNGVDPLYLFRSQRLLQRKNVDVWERSTQMDSSGKRLEIAFADLYPQKVPASWKRPKVEVKSPVPNGAKKAAGKPAAAPVAADTNEGTAQSQGCLSQQVC